MERAVEHERGVMLVVMGDEDKGQAPTTARRWCQHAMLTHHQYPRPTSTSFQLCLKFFNVALETKKNLASHPLLPGFNPQFPDTILTVPRE